MGKMLNVSEASEFLGISKNTLYRYIFDKEIAYYKPNNRLVYFAQEDLEQFLQRKRIPAKE